MSPQEPTTTQMIMSFIILLIIASLTAYYADRKGRSFTIWFILGVLLGVFAPLILFFLPSLKENGGIAGEPTMTISRPDPALQDLPPSPPVTLIDRSEEENKLWYYLDKDHQQMGPVSMIALRDMWNRGLLELNSYVWSEGMGQWKKVDELPNLKEALHRQ